MAHAVSKVATAMTALSFVALLASCGSHDGRGESSTSSESPTQETVAAEPETFDVQGTISLKGGCGSTANSYYPDISKGAQVTILNASSEAVALGALDRGRNAPGYVSCIFAFAVPDVPSDGNIFSLVVGSRAPYQFSKEDALSLTLSLGD